MTSAAAAVNLRRILPGPVSVWVRSRTSRRLYDVSRNCSWGREAGQATMSDLHGFLVAAPGGVAEPPHCPVDPPRVPVCT